MTAVRVTECAVLESGEDVVEVLAPPRPAAAAHALGKNAVRGVAFRNDCTLIDDVDSIPRAAAAACAAQSEIKRDRSVASAAAGVRGAQAARPAAAAHALGQDADGVGTARIDGSEIGDNDDATVARAAAFATGANSDAETPTIVIGSRGAGVGKGHAQRIIHDCGFAAIAAAAAHTLGEDAIGAFAQGHNGTRIEDQHIATRTAAAAVAADGDADLFGLFAEGQRTGHTETAGATPAANALGEDAVGQIPFGFNAAGIDNNHQTAHSTGAAVAAHGKTDGGFFGDAAGNTKPTVTAPTADALRKNAVGPVALGRVGWTIADECHIAAVGSAAALAADGDLDCG